jgi:hypothetical protein
MEELDESFFALTSDCVVDLSAGENWYMLADTRVHMDQVPMTVAAVSARSQRHAAPPIDDKKHVRFTLARSTRKVSTETEKTVRCMHAIMHVSQLTRAPFVVTGVIVLQAVGESFVCELNAAGFCALK